MKSGAGMHRSSLTTLTLFSIKGKHIACRHVDLQTDLWLETTNFSYYRKRRNRHLSYVLALRDIKWNDMVSRGNGSYTFSDTLHNAGSLVAKNTGEQALRIQAGQIVSICVTYSGVKYLGGKKQSYMSNYNNECVQSRLVKVL